MSAKVAKPSVNYRPADEHSTKRCESCSMYRKGNGEKGTCTLVRGAIDPSDVCDEWEPKGDG